MPIVFDLGNTHVVDITKEIDSLVPPFWIIAQSSQHPGRDLRDLENECAKELGVQWQVVFEEVLQGVYEKEADCAAVAIAMMRRQPDLELWVKCSDPEWRPAYMPMAHFELKPTLSFGTDK